ncbi:hypothetical protein FB451DRAFT_1185332 [Mycena latifolia]|nr:hypothetical protein FB451DRAFT_1185332 [Mycena latifolia]
MPTKFKTQPFDWLPMDLYNVKASLSPCPSNFAQNQPQPLGRGVRPNAENEAYTNHRATLQKNAEIGARRQARTRNQQARLAADAAPATPAAAVTQAQSTPSAQEQHRQPATPSMPRPALQPIPFQQPGLVHASPLSTFPVRSYSTSTPSHGPSQRVQEDSRPVYADFQAGPPRRSAMPTEYADLQKGLPQTSFASTTADAFSTKMASMSPGELQNLMTMLDQAGYTLPPLDNNFPSTLRDHRGDSDDYNFGASSLGDHNGRSSSPEPSGWNGDRPVTPEQDAARPGADDEDNLHRNAQSSLTSGSDARGRGPSEASPTPSGMYCRSLHLLQATIYLFQPAVAATADPSSDSEAEQRPTQRRRGNNDQSKSKKRKKRPGRQQPSRSIREIPLEHQPIVKATYPVIQREIVCTSGWAKDSPSGKPGASDDELGNMILDSWDEAHEALDLPYVGPPTTPEKNLIRSRVPAVRTAFRKVASQLVPGQFGLVDPQNLPNSTPELIAATVEANRAIIAKIEHTFYYSNPMDPTIPDTMYRHGVLQAVFNLTCFGKKGNRRGHYFTDMDAIPVETLALVVTAITCVLDEWKTGRQVDHKFEADPYAAYYDRALAHLRGWVTYNADKAIDVAKPLLKNMLRVARETSGTVQVVQPAENEFLGFSATAYATNQPSA